jgi:hypothetical protein
MTCGRRWTDCHGPGLREVDRAGHGSGIALFGGPPSQDGVHRHGWNSTRVTGTTVDDLWGRQSKCHKGCARFPTIHRPNYYSHWLNNEPGTSSGESESR